MTTSNSQTILTDLINYLHGLDPDISTAEGDPIRLILQAVSQELAQAQFTSLASDNFLDLTQKSGVDLDAFGSFFGILRWAGTPAQTVIQFYADSPLKTNFSIAQGTLVTDGFHPFETTQGAVFKAGTTSIEVPASSVNLGASQNVQPYTLTSLPSSLSQTGIYAQNPSAAAGGTNQETDAHYRTRIQNTFLKNHVGTPASYENLALSIDNATRAKCLTAISIFAEQSEIVPLKTAFGGGDGFVSTILDAKYVYPNSSYLIKNALQNGQTNFIEGVNYDFNTAINSTVPIFQISSQDLSDLLSQYSGAGLDAIGSQLGLQRFQGSATTGTLNVTAFPAFDYDYQVPSGAQFSLYLASSSTTYTATLQASASLPSGQATSQSVPFSFGTVGPVEVEAGSSLTALAPLPSSLSATLLTIAQGETAWTDDQYRSQLESMYASQTALNEGDVVYSQFRYCASSSRNTPPAVCNKVDIFTDASVITDQTEIGLIDLTEITSANQENWVLEDGTYPAAGSSIQILETPCASGLSGTLSTGSAQYEVSFLKDDTLLRNSDRAQNAVLFPAGATLPSAGATYSVPLLVNSAISDTQNAVSEVSSLGMDVLAHEGRKAYVTANLVIIPLLGTPAQTLQTFVETQLSSYLSQVEFGSQVILSDLIYSLFQTSSGVSYIKAVRLAGTNDVKAPTITGDALQMGLQVSVPYYVSPSETSSMNGTYTGDFYLPQDMYPVFNSVNIALDAANTYVNSFLTAGSSTSSNGQATQGDSTWFQNPQFYVA